MYVISEIDYYNVGDRIVMVNLVTGACELIHISLKEAMQNQDSVALRDFLPRLKSRGYIFDSEKEYKNYISEINRKLEVNDVYQAPNFLIVPSYQCNLACEYCFEKNYQIVSSLDDIDWNRQCDFMLDVIRSSPYYNSKWYRPEQINFTLMGGEPFLPENYNSIRFIINFLKKHNFTYNAITNGVCLCNYLTVFDDYKPKSIQITLDGTKEKHNLRRVFPNGSGSFDAIIKSIHSLIERKIKTYIRFNLDADNVDNLLQFSNFIFEEFSNSEYCTPYVYPMQDGGCFYDDVILSEEKAIRLVSEMVRNSTNAKLISIFHGSDLIDFIRGRNKHFKMRNRNCAANKNQYIVDYRGDVYKCWYGIGNVNFSIGNCKTSDTEFILGNKINSLWKHRSVQTIKECNICKYRYLCGGGCLSHVFDGTEESIMQPHCVDFENLIKTQIEELLKR